MFQRREGGFRQGAQFYGGGAELVLIVPALREMQLKIGMVRVVVWNINHSQRALEELTNMEADVALLQEVHVGGWEWLARVGNGVEWRCPSRAVAAVGTNCL